VLGRHAGLSHFLDWQRNEFGIAPDDRVGQLTGLSFNVLLRSVFLPLTSGATLCLPDDLDDLSAERVLPWLEAERISVLHVVPTLTQSWLAQRPPGYVQHHLRYAFSAGEPLVDALVYEFREVFPRAEVVLLYGQTETTMAKCFARMGSELPRGPQPVGRPLPSTQALVLGPSGRMCGVSELGEVAIRTPFRTLGYIDAPEDDAKRFVPNPFRADATDRIYLTGDRGYYLPDGALQLVGRTDDQLKVWGVRVEPGEVAAALSTHPDVREAFVALRASPNATPALVAWVVASNRPAVSDLRAHVAARLPPAALPAAWVFLDALPVNANGKIDRERLPAPELATREHVAPRTRMERDIVAIWRDLLGHERVGVEDDFFELGGHSLLATRMASRIRSAFGVELPLRTLFEQPTVAGVARAVVERQLESMSDDDFETLLGEAQRGD
jgi:acyl-coenzyme A synthetase/AMP-(fatty) acid ligase/acyl carrier protein